MQGLASLPARRSMHDVRSARAQVWLEGLGDWSWPGRGGGGASAAVELQPPSWVPALPHRLESAVAAPALPGAHRGRRGFAWRYGSSLLLVALAAVCVGLALDGRAQIERLTGIQTVAHRSAAELALDRSIANAPSPQQLPSMTLVSRDAAGSSIESSSYASSALNGEGSFLTYLPPGYAGTDAHYPVIYLLHGDDETDSSFLQIGLQETLDRLIAQHAIPPVIAVMIQGGPGSNNWLNQGTTNYESYVLEVQQLVDRMLPTIPDRDARAIAGYSMGGYGAMHTALMHPTVFGTVESWLGFFNGLEPQVQVDRSVIAHEGLRAYVYGGAQDVIANPAEDLPFAAALRADGADAHGAVYPGEHSLATLAEHLEHMLVFAGHGLA
jgi:enterochelin esterase-like enzyme